VAKDKNTHLLNLKGDYQARIHSGQVVVRKGGWTALTPAKSTHMRVGKRL
jgi:hypothetical protein